MGRPYKGGRREYAFDPQYAEFRQAVRKRDGYCCQFPRCTEHRPKRLHVHHIRPWSEFPHLRYDPDNGITLCRRHHELATGNESQFLAVFLMIVGRNKNGKS